MESNEISKKEKQKYSITGIAKPHIFDAHTKRTVPVATSCTIFPSLPFHPTTTTSSITITD